MIAIVVAGGRVEGPLADAFGTDVKALGTIGGRTLLDVAIEVARAAGALRVLVVGGAAVRAHCAGFVDEVLDESSEGRENVKRAMIAGNDYPLALLSSDMPFVTGDALARFLAAAAGADVALPVASGDAYEAAYPGAPSHVTALGGERIANGNAVYFAPQVAARILPIAQRLFDARKSLWQMAWLLGPGLLAKFATRRLRIADIEARAASTLGVSARAVRESDPSLCFDVDTYDDYRYATEHLAHH